MKELKQEKNYHKPKNNYQEYYSNVELITKDLGLFVPAEMTGLNVQSKDLKGQNRIENEHVENNKTVRNMLTQRGIIPENLPPAEDVKKIQRKLDSDDKKIDLLLDIIPKLDKLEMPKGYYYKLSGEKESEGDALGGNFLSVIILSGFLFIAVLLLQFKTFKGIIIVMSIIPLGILGGILFLIATGNPMSLVSIIGFIGLSGIQVKNSLLLVDFTNQLRQEGKSIDEAIAIAGETRFLPVVLTSVTAICGLIPLALNSNPQISPLAIVLIGGLISSTILSRIVTPVMYKLMPPAIEIDK